MKTFQELLRELNACQDARMWARGKTIDEVVEECHRGDWLLWLARKVDIGLKPLTLTKGLCANTVRHLMKGEQSMKAVDVAIAFGEGKATLDELNNAAAYADAAYDAAYDAYDAAYDAASAANAYAAGAAAGAAAYAAAAYAYADAAARTQNQKQTADICREHIGQLIIDKVNELLKN